MDSLYKGIKSLAAFFNRITKIISVILMMIMVVIMFSQVVGRFVFSRSIIWSEEVLRFMLIWLVFLGVSTAIYYNDLSSFDLLHSKLSKSGKKIVSTLIFLIIGIVLYYTTIGVFPLISRQLAQRAMSVPISMGIVYMVIPYSTILSLFYLIMHTIELWFDYSNLPKGEEGIN